MSHNQIMNQLINLLDQSSFEMTSLIYLPKPVLVGSNHNGDAFCTYISRSSKGGLYMNVIFNEQVSDIYDRDYEFCFVCYNDMNNPGYEFAGEEKVIDVLPDALQRVLESIQTAGDTWLSHQLDLQKKSRNYRRMMTSGKTLTWDERIDRQRIDIELDQVSWNRTYSSDVKTLNEMLEMGEQAYDQKQKELLESTKGWMSDLINNIIEEEKNNPRNVARDNEIKKKIQKDVFNMTSVDVVKEYVSTCTELSELDNHELRCVVDIIKKIPVVSRECRLEVVDGGIVFNQR